MGLDVRLRGRKKRGLIILGPLLVDLYGNWEPELEVDVLLITRLSPSYPNQPAVMEFLLAFLNPKAQNPVLFQARILMIEGAEKKKCAAFPRFHNAL
jgi:hypothetical protein